MKNRPRGHRWVQRCFCIFRICAVFTASLATHAQVAERASSPDGKYSVEVVRGAKSSLVLLKDGEVVARVPAEVGPESSFFQTLWSPDGKYVAINKQRSSRPGGDEMWIVALTTGKVLREPDDALWNNLDQKAWAYIDEKHLTQIGGKAFLTLTASGWEKDRLRFKLEVGFSELEDRYRFEGTINPSNPSIADWKITEVKS